MSAARHEPATAQVLGGRYRLEERIGPAVLAFEIGTGLVEDLLA